MNRRAREARRSAGPPGHHQEPDPGAPDPGAPDPGEPDPHRGHGPAARHRGWNDRRGSLSLEAVLILPVIAMLAIGLLQVAAIVSDVLLVHEAARAGARTAATTSGTAPVVQAARSAAPELDAMTVQVDPIVRRDGDIARVEVTIDRTLGPVSHTLRARSVVRVEPAVGTTRRDAVP